MIHVFIINAHAGKGGFSAGLRNHLAERKDIRYYIMHTRRHRDEAALAREVLSLFEGEKIRIYSCGGSGTFRNVLDGVKDPSKVELAFYPKGLTNDFLKTFGDDQKKFNDVDNLIDGDVIKIDYIKTNYGLALNTFSVGLDTVQVKKMDDFRAMSVFGKKVPYVLGFIAAIFKSIPYELEVIFDDKRHIGKFSEVFFGNGGVIGGILWFEKTTDPVDGKGRLAVVKSMSPINLVKNIAKLLKKDISCLDKNGLSGYVDKLTIRRRDGAAFIVDLDGDLQDPQKEWTAEIVKEGLNFVVPKGVRVK